MLTPDASEAISPRSSRATRWPYPARWNAVDAPVMPPPITRTSVSIVEAMMRLILPCGERSVHASRLALAHDRDRLAHAGRRLRVDVLVLGLPRPIARGVPLVARRGGRRLLALRGRAGRAVAGRRRARRSCGAAPRDSRRRGHARAL